MRSFLEARAGRTIVEVCAGIRSGERVLVITDPLLARVGEVVAGAAAAAGAEVTVAVMSPRRWDGEEPPAAVEAAMQVVDVILFPTVKDIAHTHALRAALKRGARAVSMAGFDEELLASDAMQADFRAEAPRCRRVAELLGQASQARIQGPGGTDVTLSLEGRQGNSHACVVSGPGEFTGVPNIEANISPVEGTAEGRIVFDASVPNLRTGLLREPIELTVRAGRVVDVRGGRDARALARLWQEQDDPNVYNIAQLAIGLNPKCRQATGGLVHDHGVFGSVHFGIGTSRNLGGTVDARGHVDGILYDATVALDGRLIVADGDVMV